MDLSVLVRAQEQKFDAMLNAWKERKGSKLSEIRGLSKSFFRTCQRELLDAVIEEFKRSYRGHDFLDALKAVRELINAK